MGERSVCPMPGKQRNRSCPTRKGRRTSVMQAPESSSRRSTQISIRRRLRKNTTGHHRRHRRRSSNHAPTSCGGFYWRVCPVERGLLWFQRRVRLSLGQEAERNMNNKTFWATKSTNGFISSCFRAMIHPAGSIPPTNPVKPSHIGSASGNRGEHFDPPQGYLIKGLTMLTEFGKALRMMRIEHGNKTLGDLGSLLGVSATFISAIETGKKSVPPTFLNDLKRVLGLGEAEVRQLESSASKQAKEISMGLHQRSDRARELAVAFARRFETMSEDEVKKVFQNLDEL